MSNRNLSVVDQTMDSIIDERIATIEGTYQTLLRPAMKKVVWTQKVEACISVRQCEAACCRVRQYTAACRSTQVNRTSRHLIRIWRDGSIPGDTGLDVRNKPAPYRVQIGNHTIYRAYGFSGSLQVGKKQQSTPPSVSRNTPKLDTAVDRKFPLWSGFYVCFQKVIKLWAIPRFCQWHIILL